MTVRNVQSSSITQRIPAMRGGVLARLLLLVLVATCAAQVTDSELESDLPPNAGDAKADDKPNLGNALGADAKADGKPVKRDPFAETRRILEVRTKMLGEAHPDTLEVMKELARALQNAPGTRREGFALDKKADMLYGRDTEENHGLGKEEL